MTKKTMFPNEIMEEDEKSLIERELVKLIDKTIQERLIELGIDDIKIIARELMPDIDAMIAKKVKKHFYEIGLFIVDKFDIGE
jgi:hypothetical protein